MSRPASNRRPTTMQTMAMARSAIAVRGAGAKNANGVRITAIPSTHLPMRQRRGRSPAQYSRRTERG